MHAAVSVNDWECTAVKVDGVAEPQAVWAVIPELLPIEKARRPDTNVKYCLKYTEPLENW